MFSRLVVVLDFQIMLAACAEIRSVFPVITADKHRIVEFVSFSVNACKVLVNRISVRTKSWMYFREILEWMGPAMQGKKFDIWLYRKKTNAIKNVPPLPSIQHKSNLLPQKYQKNFNGFDYGSCRNLALQKLWLCGLSHENNMTFFIFQISDLIPLAGHHEGHLASINTCCMWETQSDLQNSRKLGSSNKNWKLWISSGLSWQERYSHTVLKTLRVF